MPPPRRVLFDVLVDLHQQMTVARARVHHVARLSLEVLPSEDHVDMAPELQEKTIASLSAEHEVLEERGMLRATPNDVQSALHMDLRVLVLHAHEAPARVLEEDVLELRLRCS